MWPYSSENEPCLSSCLQEEPSPTPGGPDVSAPVDKEKETEEKVHSCGERRVFSPEEHRAIGGAIERLGLQLLEKLPIGLQQPNVVLSPLSLAFALAHLTLGQSEFSWNGYAEDKSFDLRTWLFFWYHIQSYML